MNCFGVTEAKGLRVLVPNLPNLKDSSPNDRHQTVKRLVFTCIQNVRFWLNPVVSGGHRSRLVYTRKR
jgi:hypothetical protein